MSETKVSKEIIAMIKKEFPQIQIDRHHCGMAKGYRGGIVKLGTPGWFDYIGYMPDGRFIGIEIKAPSSTTQKKRKALQFARRTHAQNCGCVAFQTDNVEHCREQLQEALSA